MGGFEKTGNDLMDKLFENMSKMQGISQGLNSQPINSSIEKIRVLKELIESDIDLPESTKAMCVEKITKAVQEL